MKTKINAVLFAFFAAALLAGCASTKMVWTHPSDPSANLEIDKRLCWSEALLKVSGLSEDGVPMPGGESLGTQSPKFVKVSYAEGFQQGAAAVERGLRAGARNAAIQAHYEACMYAKGWVLVEEGSAPQPNTPE